MTRVFPTSTLALQSTDCVTAAEAAEPTDLDLVRRAQAGDSEAFGQLVERNGRAVFRTALAAVGSAAEADDIAQDAFVTAYRKLESFRGDSSFKTWLLTIAWNKAIDRRKSLTRWLTLTVQPRDSMAEDAPDPIERVPAGGRPQDDAVADAELQRTLRRLIGKLPRKLRDALLLAGSGEHTYEEMARMLGAPTGTVKWRVSEARRILKQKLVNLGLR